MESLPYDIFYFFATTSARGWKLAVIVSREFGLWSTTTSGQEKADRLYSRRYVFEQTLWAKKHIIGRGRGYSIKKRVAYDSYVKIWMKNGRIHREDGPAVVVTEGMLSHSGYSCSEDECSSEHEHFRDATEIREYNYTYACGAQTKLKILYYEKQTGRKSKIIAYPTVDFEMNVEEIRAIALPENLAEIIDEAKKSLVEWREKRKIP